MVASDYTQFKGVSNIGDTMVITNLENNLKHFLDWCFLGIGGYINVTIPTSGYYGGTFHNLKVVDYPGYTAGQVWAGIRKDWVWETGVSFTGTAPIAISGVYINGTFFSKTDSTYGHFYDYKNGLVIFTGIVSTNSGVTLNYSYRTIQTEIFGRESQVVELQFDSFRPDSTQWTSYSPYSGTYSNFASARDQMPKVTIDAVPRRDSRPYEVGNLHLWVEQDVIFEISAEDKVMRDRIIDILTLEQGREILLYDTDNVVRANKYPLDYRGMLINPTGMYPYLVDNYFDRKCFFKNTSVSEVETLMSNLHSAKVRMTCELQVGLV